MIKRFIGLKLILLFSLPFLLSVGVADSSRTSEKIAREEALSKQERVFGLVTIYRGAKQHFAWFEQVPTLNWDKAFMEYLPLVERDQGLYDYYRLLQSFVALLEDGHTDIRLPSKIEKELDALPLKLDLVEKKWVVIQRYPVQEILDEDIPVGTVVLSIEGKSPLNYFQEKLFPYLSGGDAHQKQNAVNRRLFLRNTSLSMDMRYPDGTFHNRVLKANRGTVKWSDDLRQRFHSHSEVSSPYESRLLPDGLLYVRYSQCEDGYEKELSTLIKSMSDNWPRAIIVDLRSNPGGNTPYKLLGHLISTPIEAGIRKTRCSISELDSQLQTVLERDSLSPAVTEALNRAIEAGHLPKGYSPGWITSEGSIEPNPIHYDGPLYLIVDSGTGSAAEDFVAILKGCGRAKVVGTPTVGSTGNSIRFNLPGGGSVRICVAQAKFANGEDFIPMGVQPDILLHRTIKGIIDNRDEILELALDFVRGELQ
ncbi:MAG TPA: S41 family peptidase [Sedimentisphaerales bacterium]|nr:S41 family peptidase [Sedimentisphaerales bacterium]